MKGINELRFELNKIKDKDSREQSLKILRVLEITVHRKDVIRTGAYAMKHIADVARSKGVPYHHIFVAYAKVNPKYYFADWILLSEQDKMNYVVTTDNSRDALHECTTAILNELFGEELDLNLCREILQEYRGQYEYTRLSDVFGSECVTTAFDKHILERYAMQYGGCTIRGWFEKYQALINYNNQEEIHRIIITHAMDQGVNYDELSKLVKRRS